jgi:hypothetical protein
VLVRISPPGVHLVDVERIVARATQLLYSLPSCRVSGSVRLDCQLAFTMSAETTCYTVVYDDNSGDAPSTQELREGLQKGSDDVKFDTLRRIIVSTINGNPQVGLYVSYERSISDDVCVCVPAATTHASHSIRDALKGQDAQEAAALLLGGVPKV